MRDVIFGTCSACHLVLITLIGYKFCRSLDCLLILFKVNALKRKPNDRNVAISLNSKYIWCFLFFLPDCSNKRTNKGWKVAFKNFLSSIVPSLAVSVCYCASSTSDWSFCFVHFPFSLQAPRAVGLLGQSLWIFRLEFISGFLLLVFCSTSTSKMSWSVMHTRSVLKSCCRSESSSDTEAKEDQATKKTWPTLKAVCHLRTLLYCRLYCCCLRKLLW